MKETMIRPNPCAVYVKEKDQKYIKIGLSGFMNNYIDPKVLLRDSIFMAKRTENVYQGDYTFYPHIYAYKAKAKYDNFFQLVNATLNEPYEGAQKVNIK